MNEKLYYYLSYAVLKNTNIRYFNYSYGYDQGLACNM